MRLRDGAGLARPLRRPELARRAVAQHAGDGPCDHVARFYQMLLNGSQLDGKRLLSEPAVKQMTSRRTPPDLKESWGLGVAAGLGFFRHGGAYSTNTSADTARGLLFVWLVQQAGFPGEGGKAQGAFKKAALDAFRAARPARANGAARPEP